MKLVKGIKNMIKSNRYAFYIWTCMHYMCNSKFTEKVMALSRDPNILFIRHNGSLYPGKLLYLIEFEDEKSGFCAIYRNTLGALNFMEQLGGCQ